MYLHGPLAGYLKLWDAHAPGMLGTFSPLLQVSDPDMHHGTCVTHVPRCMPGSLTSCFLWNLWWWKRSQHSRRMRNPQFCVSGKRPIDDLIIYDQIILNIPKLIKTDHMMVGHAFVVAKEVFHHNNRDNFILWICSNDGKQFLVCKFNYFDKHFCGDPLTLVNFVLNVHWWANKAPSWFIKHLTIRIISVMY